MAVAVDMFGHMGAPGAQMQKIRAQESALGRAHGRPGKKGKKDLKDLGFVVWLLAFFFFPHRIPCILSLL